MEIKVDDHQGRVTVTVFHITGNIDSNTHREFEQEAERVIQTGAQHILLDFKHVKYMSSRGFQVIQHIFTKLREKYPHIREADMRKGINAGTYKFPYLKLCNLSTDVSKVLGMGGFDMYLEVHKDVDSAVASF
jgi:anti-anti-sigma factor